MFNPTDVIEVLANNVRKTKNPFGLSSEKLKAWCKELDLKKEGEYLLFTGFMYQMIPYIENTTKQMEKYEDTKATDYSKFMKYIPSSLVGIGIDLMVSKKQKNEGIEILKDICKLLDISEVDYFYDPGLDFYSGILLYDLGDVENFKRHAEWVSKKLTEKNIKKIITVDPHTTYALKVLYPKYVGVLFEVKPYLELINIEGKSNKKVIVHDPCFYGRYLQISHIPREVLKRAGIKVEDVRFSSNFTHCCGGPAESISPKVSKKIRERRLAQLEGDYTIVTMCPICFSNLRKGSKFVEDIATILCKEAKN